MKKVGLYILASALTTMLAILLNPSFFAASVELVKTEGIVLRLQTITKPGNLYFDPFFILPIGGIPLLVYGISSAFRIRSARQLGIVWAIILLGGVLGWGFRIVMVRLHFSKLLALQSQMSQDVLLEYSITQLHFGQYVSIGIAVGTILTGLIFWQRGRLRNN